MARDGRTRSGSILFPMILIGLGVLMLMSIQLPYFDPWPILGRYWPLLLILAGGGMLFDRTRREQAPQGRPVFPVGVIAGTLVFALLLGILLWRGHSFERRERWSAPSARARETRTVEKQDAKAARMTLHMPAGELRLKGGATALLHADFYSSGNWSTPDVRYSVEGGVGALEIDQSGGGQFMPKSDNTWDLQVNNEIPLELKIDMGAGRCDLNLARVDLTRLDLNIGAGQAQVDLTGERAKDLEAVIHGGVGQATVRLPRAVGVVVVAHGGLGSINVHGLKEDDGRYVNEAYGKAPNTLRLTVEGGIGQIILNEE
ncbi:MAG TPA: toast rack family protein [Candidatus Acidoferrum sp.]